MTDTAVNALPDAPDAPAPIPWLEEMPPRQIVAELNRYIVGQEAAKKAVAIAVRNRWRRAQAPGRHPGRDHPYNIIMIGPTGVGKTEVARRLARLSGAPFIKVEASKFTEVGYVGRDAESMVRDLVDAAINMVRTEREDEVYPQAGAAGRRAAARPAPPAARRPRRRSGPSGGGQEERRRSSGVRGRLERPGQAREGRHGRGGAAAAARARSCGRCWRTGSSTTARWRSRSRRRASP